MSGIPTFQVSRWTFRPQYNQYLNHCANLIPKHYWWLGRLETIWAPLLQDLGHLQPQVKRCCMLHLATKQQHLSLEQFINKSFLAGKHIPDVEDLVKVATWKEASATGTTSHNILTNCYHIQNFTNQWWSEVTCCSWALQFPVHYQSQVCSLGRQTPGSYFHVPLVAYSCFWCLGLSS